MTFNPMLGYLKTKEKEQAAENNEPGIFVPPIPPSLSFLFSKDFPVTSTPQLEPIHDTSNLFSKIIPAPKITLLNPQLTEDEISCIPDTLFSKKDPAPIELPKIPDFFSLGITPPTITPPLLAIPGTTPVFHRPLPESRNPFKTLDSNYEIVLPPYATKRQIEIRDSGIRIEDLPQKDLREVYYFLKGRMNSIIWRASTIQDVALRGEPRKEDEREENEWMYTGSAIHEAMETQGENLKNLYHFGGLGDEPVKPESTLSKDHIDMMKEIIVNKVSSTEAYIKVKDNLTTKGINLEWLSPAFIFPCIAERERLTEVMYTAQLRYDDHIAGTLEDLSDEEAAMTEKQLEKKLASDVKIVEKDIKAVKDSEEFKSVSKVSKSAMTEFDKFKDELPKFESYLKAMDIFDIRKNQVRTKAKAAGGTVLDDLTFTTTKGFRIYETIARTYGALANNKEAFDIYHPYKTSKNNFECFSEYVILYDYKLPNGKTVPFMSMVDRYIIDHTSKIAWVIDLKTYGKQGNFIHTNYKDHAYWRAMAVYYEAIRIDLERRGLTGYKIQTSILPISIVSLEVGVFGIPLLNLSKEEIQMGTNGGMMKFQGSVFNDQKEVCTAMSEKLIQHFIETDQISANSPEFYVRGWKRIVEDYEMRKVPTMASMPV